MFCTKCGNSVSDNDRFCSKCGAKIDRAPLQTSTQHKAQHSVKPRKRGLFTPRISQQELQYVQTLLNQLQDSARILNTTTKPDVFFERLNFSFDLLLELQSYEKYNIFKANTPTDDYQKIISNLDATVNDFIDRAVATNDKKIANLKTESAKKRNREDFAIKLISAFDCAHTFWTGNFSQSRTFPHYTGPLYTQSNYLRVQAIYDSLDSE